VILEPEIAAGLDTLPRQLRTFSEVRRALLHGVAGKTALSEWRARDERDLGVMWLEMWAYVSDVLAFYDERIANETYVRTAQRRPSLRRIVGLLGYVPAPGIGGTATLAAIADGRAEVSVPAGTAVRSDAFGDEPPQVFETTTETKIHPFKNQWQIGPVKGGSLPQRSPAQAPGQRGAGTPLGAFFLFETAGLNVAKDRLVLFEFPDGSRSASKVKSIAPFSGKDGRTYSEVEFDPPVALPSSSFAPEQVRIRTPSATAVVTRNIVDASPAAPIYGSTAVLDTVYRQLKVSDPVISAVEAAGSYQVVILDQVTEGFAILSVPLDPELEPARIPVTRVHFDRSLVKIGNATQVVFHHSFVDAGTLSTVPDDMIPKAALLRDGGVPITGAVEIPPEAKPGPDGITLELNQEFLLTDADEKGAQVTGVVRFAAGRATFQVTDESDLSLNAYKAPLTVFGNLLATSRGETVFDEELGRGDARQANQQFTLSRPPLTYLFDPQEENGIVSTLDVKVDGVSWTEVKSFYGRGPTEAIFVVERDDEQNTTVRFGDGVRGARIPSGAQVVATYRAGAGRPSPPAGAITQIARPFLGLRSVRSPIDALPGSDADSSESLRTLAPRSMLLFGRAVSVRDFETLASLTKGVLKAVAEFVWIESQQRAGVQVTYIGDAPLDELKARLVARAEANLSISVQAAAPWPSTLALDLVYDSRFDPEDVRRRVRESLLAGLLSPARAEIGGQLWVSRIYQAVQEIEGVVAVQSAQLTVPNASPLTIKRVTDSQYVGVAATGFAVKKSIWSTNAAGQVSYSLGPLDVACTAAGAFLDFRAANAVSVTATTKAAPLDVSARRPREV
jgi:hypothetical protein